MEHTFQRPRLLVVDDDFDMTNTLKELLSDYDYDVDVACDGVQALGKIRSQSYNAILCDYQMPRMNGQALYETLQQSHPEAVSRFIFVTANARVPEVLKFFRSVKVPFLEKPFRSAEVVHLVQKVLQTSTN